MKTTIEYDEEGDLLEVIIGQPTESYLNNLGDDIFERIDKKTKEVKGFTILGFKKRLQEKQQSHENAMQSSTQPL